MATAADTSSRTPGLSMGASSALLVAFAAGGVFGSYTVPIRAEHAQHRRVEIGHDSPMVLELLADVEDTIDRLEQLEVLDPSLSFVDAPDVAYDGSRDWEIVSTTIKELPAPRYRESDFEIWS